MALQSTPSGLAQVCTLNPRVLLLYMSIGGGGVFNAHSHSVHCAYVMYSGTLKNEHIGTRHFVHCRQVVLFSQVPIVVPQCITVIEKCRLYGGYLCTNCYGYYGHTTFSALQLYSICIRAVKLVLLCTS